MAPEVFKHEEYDTKVDVFSFALILQEVKCLFFILDQNYSKGVGSLVLVHTAAIKFYLCCFSQDINIIYEHITC